MAPTAPTKAKVKQQMIPALDLPPRKDELLLPTYMERLLRCFDPEVTKKFQKKILGHMFNIFHDGGPPFMEGFKVFRNKPK